METGCQGHREELHLALQGLQPRVGPVRAAKGCDQCFPATNPQRHQLQPGPSTEAQSLQEQRRPQHREGPRASRCTPLCAAHARRGSLPRPQGASVAHCRKHPRRGRAGALGCGRALQPAGSLRATPGTSPGAQLYASRSKLSCSRRHSPMAGKFFLYVNHSLDATSAKISSFSRG